MKCLTSLPIIILSVAAVSAEANDGRGCLAQSAGLKNQERTVFLTKCLADVSRSENVYVESMKHKLQRCNQNTKNLALLGQDKGDYIYSCLSENDAAEKIASSRASTKLALRTVQHLELVQ
jgi:hypothetical protein